MSQEPDTQPSSPLARANLSRDTVADALRSRRIGLRDELIGIIDATQHVDEFPDFEDRYNWILLRVEVAVRLMLELWKMRTDH